jgi:hypothetical protein
MPTVRRRPEENAHKSAAEQELPHRVRMHDVFCAGENPLCFGGGNRIVNRIVPRLPGLPPTAIAPKQIELDVHDSREVHLLEA